MEEKNKLKILDTDVFYDNSPNTGDSDCICSRCGNNIRLKEKIFRKAIGAGDLVAKDFITGMEAPVNIGGYEFRLCEKCFNDAKNKKQ